MKRIGILAHSAEGSALCYRTICDVGQQKLGPHNHPDVTLDLIAMRRSMPSWERGDFQEVGEILAVSVGRLKDAGCDFFVCPDNTAHLALGALATQLPLPGIHIADAVMAEARRFGLVKAGILGTRWTMTESMYFDAGEAICDHIAGMTDGFLMRTYERLFSPRMGSVFDRI